MSWLDKLDEERVYKYTCKEEGITFKGTKDHLEHIADLSEGKHLKFVPGDSFTLWDEDDKELIFSYAGFEPAKIGIMMKITFEKNGRKAIRIKTSDGKSHVRSMSRENLLKGKGTRATELRYDEKGNVKGRGVEVESVFTKGFKEHVNKQKEKIVHNKLTHMKKLVEHSNYQRSKK